MFSIFKNRSSEVERRHIPVSHNRLGNMRGGHRFMDAAKSDALNAGWLTTNYTADSILRQELSKVRARSRYLAVNDPYFSRFIKLAQENIVGSQGITLSMRVIESVQTDGTILLDSGANRIIEDAWWKWSKRRYTTFDQRDSFLNVQHMVLSSVVRDGEIFIRKVRDKNNPFAFSLQLIEADHVPISFDKELPNGHRVRMGIEVDANNKVVAYHMLEKHPGDHISMMQRSHFLVRIPAEQIIHVYMRERVTQTRGIPWGVSSMQRSKMLDGYEQAELVAARAGASKMGFILEKEGGEYTGDETGVDENGQEVTITDFDAGTFEKLPSGVDVKLFDPQHPSGNFDNFTKRILRGISAGFNIGYNTLANDYEGVNYSSLRQSNLSERDCWKRLQQWFLESLHEEIFPDWLEMSLTSGAVALPIAKYDKFNQPTWRTRGWQWVDPLKEKNALRIGVGLGVDSVTKAAAEMGVDIEEIYQDMKQEALLREKYSITLQSPDDIIVIEKNKEEDDA